MKYEAVIGLEVHIQLNTVTKAFCADKNEFSKSPNKHVSPVSLGLPGTLPYMNRQHIDKALKLGIALNCEINRHTFFDRKNYFYPDLPKGYQITQQNEPICIGGAVKLSNRVISIHHIHMEEDAGKSLHDKEQSISRLDYNRAGVPLLELVTEPELSTPDEVYEFMSELRRLVRYLDVSDGIMQEGSLRCDVNISVRPKGEKTLNTRTEIKNLNSANNARKATELEIMRQIKLYKSGENVIQQTLDFDPATGGLNALRSKEDAQDYRYFPDPDMPSIHITDVWLDSIRTSIDTLPHEMVNTLINDYDLTAEDAYALSEYKEAAQHFMSLCAKRTTMKPSFIGSFYLNKILPVRKTQTNVLLPFPVNDDRIMEFLDLISADKISASAAYQNLLPALMDSEGRPEKIASEMGLIQDSSDKDIQQWVIEVVDEFPEKVKKYREGKNGLFGFFMGQIVKKSGGKANPRVTKELLKNALEAKN